jgi:HSP20 family protein
MRRWRAKSPSIAATLTTIATGLTDERPAILIQLNARPDPAATLPARPQSKRESAMVESSSTGQSFWPSIYGPLRGLGQRMADFFAPTADAAASNDAYEITVELPGVKADDIDVGVHDGTLTIKGEKRSEQKEEGRTWYFTERTFGSFLRSFRLPADADADKISADHQDGLLTITIPKKAPEIAAGKKIKVKSA